MSSPKHSRVCPKRSTTRPWLMKIQAWLKKVRWPPSLASLSSMRSRLDKDWPNRAQLVATLLRKRAAPSVCPPRTRLPATRSRSTPQRRPIGSCVRLLRVWRVMMKRNIIVVRSFTLAIKATPINNQTKITWNKIERCITMDLPSRSSIVLPHLLCQGQPLNRRL